MMECSNSSKSSTTPVKKLESSQCDRFSNQKDYHKFRSEKGLVFASTVAYSQSKRRIQFSQTKAFNIGDNSYGQSLRYKPQSNPQKKQSLNSKKQLQTSVQEIIEKTHKLINIFYPQKLEQEMESLKQQNKIKLIKFNKELRQNIIKLLKQLKYKSKQLASHLNTVYYSSPSIKILQFSQIQKQILRQWRQNTLLTSIRSEWYICIQKFLPLFQDQMYLIYEEIIYENFCQFMARLTYLMFKQFFQLQISRKNKTKENIIQKLSNQTIRYLLTQSTLWQNTVYLMIQEMLSQNCPKILTWDSQNTKKMFLKSIISEMKLKPLRRLLEQQNDKGERLFPETRHALSRFTKQHYIISKIKSIVNVRVGLQQDILTYQKKLIEREEINDFQMFQKDQILTCLMLSILDGNLCLNALYTSIKEVKLVLGHDTERILGIYKCPSYFTDIEAAVEFLIYEGNQFYQKSKQQNQQKSI